MAFDPALPLDNSTATAAQMRAQLNGLKSLIDANTTVNAAQIDSVATMPPGDPAAVSVVVDGGLLRFTFQIPQGTPGNPGAQGNDGSQGPQGPPFANAVVDAVTTLNPGAAAQVGTFFDGTNVRFTFGIPRGADGMNGLDGAPGTNGSDGGQGPQGEQGPPGEVTNAALAAAIAGTSNVTNAVATLDTPFVNDPPTLADLEVMRAKVNELILALRR